MARRRKALPKDLDALLKRGNVEELKAVFDKCRRDACGGYSRQMALAYPVPDELARWLVSEGLDVEAVDGYGRSPLWQRAAFGLDFTVLVELGADVNVADRSGDTPLHAAVRHARAVDPERLDRVAAALDTVRRLIEAGADVNARNQRHQSPLLWALATCRGTSVDITAQVTEILLAAGAAADGAADEVDRIGRAVEAMRAGSSPDCLSQTEEALHRLYELFHVTPVATRQVHDDVSPVSVSAAPWIEHQQLWELLAPAPGPAATVQGEVVRISGLLTLELVGNRCRDLDVDFRSMAKALASHLTSGYPVVDKNEAKRLLSRLVDDGRSVKRLSELAVAWVQANPDPVPLPEPGYRR